jgi:hypothetical protein
MLGLLVRTAVDHVLAGPESDDKDIAAHIRAADAVSQKQWTAETSERPFGPPRSAIKVAGSPVSSTSPKDV